MLSTLAVACWVYINIINKYRIYLNIIFKLIKSGDEFSAWP